MSDTKIESYIRWGYRLLVVAMLAVFTGCGKVTQTSSKTTDPGTFNLNYSAGTIPTADPAYKAASSNFFTLADSQMYTVVYRIGNDGKLQEESWGKAIVSVKAGATPSASPTAKTIAFSKGDIELDAADFSWAKLSYDYGAKSWSADIKKIRLGGPLYLIAFYNTRGKAYLSILDSKRVSGNATINLGALNAYDTFIAILLLNDLQEQKGIVSATVTSGQLKSFFTEDFFDLMKYKVPVTTATKFTPDNPSFVFPYPLEQQLMDIYSLWKDNESDEAKSLMDKFKKENATWIPDKAEGWLKAKLKETSTTQTQIR